MSNDAPQQTQRVCVGKRSQFTEGARQLVKCGVRNIAVVCYKGQLYAIDNACYHHGGPLLRGDIEEMGGHPCIVCPWHSYKIALDTGEGLYMGITVNPNGSPPQQTVKSKGCKQRVHKVIVDNATDDVYVIVDLTGPKWESDTYASMELANRERPTMAPVEGHSWGPSVSGIHSSIAFGVRSGHVFQQMGRGGTNPFDPSHKTRLPVSPTLLLKGQVGNSLSSRNRNTDVTNLFVSCSSITDVCPGVKEFHFTHHSGSLLRHAELGEHVELELPIPESRGTESVKSASSSSFNHSVLNSAAAKGDTPAMRRRWTICDVNRKGTLFTLMVKAIGNDPQRSGSAWLHQRSLHIPLRICSVGGTFTFVDHYDTIRQLRGNVLWLTAGIGITSAYAAMNSSLDDTFFVEGNEPLHVVHLHANHTLETVPKLGEFVRWQRRFPLVSSNTNNVREGQGTKTYVMELFISPSKENDGNSESDEGWGRRGATSPSASTIPLTHRHHLDKEDVVRAVRTYFEPDVALAYVCGPANFVTDCTVALLSAGLPEANILTDGV